MLEIELDQNNIRLEMDPTLTKPDFKAKTLTITSSTNNPTGYSVYMSTENTSLVRTEALPNGDIPEIKSLETREANEHSSENRYDETEFTNNSWGYHTGGEIFWRVIPSSSAIVASSNEAIVQNKSTVSFAAKVDATQPAGSYTGTVNFQIVTNTPSDVSFNSAMASANKTKVSVGSKEYYKMQDMSTEICNSVSADERTQLVDIRDNKVYWVLKARDGHCWMTQNLDHDIVTTENFYTPENTDITYTWNPVRATIASSNISEDGVVAGWEKSAFSPYSVDAGDQYWNLSDNWYYGGTGTYDSETHQQISGIAGPGVDAYGFNTGRAAGHFAQSLTQSEWGINENEYHNHVGNYYNWAAAMAINSESDIIPDMGGDQSHQSICPAGWRLPANAYSEVASLDEFKTLLSLYYANYNENYARTDQNMISYPLYFVRGGRVKYEEPSAEDNYAGGNRLVRLGDAGYYHVGSYGAAWSIGQNETLNSAWTTDYLTFDSITAGSTSHEFNNIPEGYGASIRCMAR